MVKIRPEEISSVIREQIKNYVTKLETADVGTVIQVADGVARIYGLEKAMQGELLEFPGEVYGMVMNLEEDNVGAVLLGDHRNVNEGDTVKTTGRVIEVPVGDALTGPGGQCSGTAHRRKRTGGYGDIPSGGESGARCDRPSAGGHAGADRHQGH